MGWLARVRARIIALALGADFKPRSHEDLRQVHLLVFLTLIAVPTTAGFAAAYLFAGSLEAAAMCGSCGIVNIACLIALRRGVRPVLCGTAVFVADTLVSAAVNVFLDGLNGPSLIWLPFTGLLAYIAFGRRSAVLVILAAIVGLVVVAALPPQVLLPPEVISALRFGSTLTAVLLALPVSMSIESAREAAEAMLARAKEEAEQTTRIKGELLANVSHELRTPLNAIVGATRRLLEAPLDPTIAEQARTAQAASESLLVLVQDLLDASRLEAGRLELHPGATDVVALVRGVVTLMAARAAERGIALEVHVRGEVPRVVVDPVRMRQIATNLVDNAVKFTEQGRVDVTLSAEPRGDRVLVRLEVQDTGVGIAGDQRDLVFERFRQGDATSTRRHGGSGLGLSIVKELVDLMGASLKLDSDPGGSCFTFTIEAERAPDVQSVEGTRVLLAEDNVVNQRVAMWMLQGLGCAVDVAQYGQEAVRLASERAYDVVLMDCQMPVLDGYAAAAQIRASAPHLAIVALTAGEGGEDDQRARAAGMDGVLRKPIDEDVLREQLTRARTERLSPPRT